MAIRTSGLDCPACGAGTNTTGRVGSREEIVRYRRERRCQGCGLVFHTEERAALFKVYNPASMKLEEYPIKHLGHFLNYLLRKSGWPGRPPA